MVHRSIAPLPVVQGFRAPGGIARDARLAAAEFLRGPLHPQIRPSLPPPCFREQADRRISFCPRKATRPTDSASARPSRAFASRKWDAAGPERQETRIV